MSIELYILDSMEEVRQIIAECPESYPADYIVRLCCSIVAKAYGYNSRTEWTGELKKHPESMYTTRLLENRYNG